MKKILKVINIVVILLILTQCGVVNNMALCVHGIKSNIIPHSHKVKIGEGGFPDNGMAIVSFKFKSLPNRNHTKVGTIWRKVNKDGTFSDKINLTYISATKTDRMDSMIESGIYFLDGLSLITKDNYILSIGSNSNIISKNQFGWDVYKESPKWIGFEIKKGQEIYFPDITVSYKCKNGGNWCQGEDIIILITMSDELDNLNNLIIGDNAEILQEI